LEYVEATEQADIYLTRTPIMRHDIAGTARLLMTEDECGTERMVSPDVKHLTIP
jgi:hypothetical protein